MEQSQSELQEDSQESKTYNVKIGTDVNGNPIMQTISADELVNGYLRQSDYTKKTQELAKEKEMLGGHKAEPAIDDDAAVEQYLASKGYAKKETVESIVEAKLKGLTKNQQDEQTIQSIMASNPDLKQFEGAIKKIAATDDSAIEDIVVKYGFTTHDKLSKAKQRSIVGGTNKLDDGKSKPVSEWTKEDWAKFEEQAKRSSFR